MKVPKKITSANAFVDPKTIENSKTKFHPGLLSSHSAVFFRPTEDQLRRQCFNLCSFLDAVMLVRLIWYRDNSPSCLVMPEGVSHEDPEFDSKANEIMDGIIRGIWIAVNIDETEMTAEQTAQVAEARQLLAKYWGNLWC